MHFIVMLFLTAVTYLVTILVGVYGEDVTLRIDYSGKSQNFQCILPVYLKVKVEQPDEGSVFTEFDLTKNDVIPWGHHVKVMKRDAEGAMRLHHTDIQEEKVTETQAYHNHRAGASFVAQCVVTEDGRSFPRLEGSFYLNGEKFLLRPASDDDESLVTFELNGVAVMYSMTTVLEHSFYEAAGVEIPGSEYPMVEASPLGPEGGIDTPNPDQPLGPPPLHRYRRATKTYYVDILPVVDYSMYKRWADQSATGRPEPEILKYVANILTAVDMRLQTLEIADTSLRARMVNPVMISTAEGAPFSEDIKHVTTEATKISAPKLLSSFENWVGGQLENFDTHDHAMLFTSYDLMPTDDPTAVFNNITKGLAGIGTVCNPTSVSLVEDKGAYQSENVAAHELGHGLGAYHDGDNNNCDSADRFLMSIGTYKQETDNLLNPWVFSSCSSAAIGKYVATKAADESLAGRCLMAQQGSEINSNVTITAQSVCERYYGPSAFPCRNYGKFSDICTALRCRTKTDANCILVTAATGTCCGNQMKCLAGTCVDAEDGECPVDESCPLGDQPVIPHNLYKVCSDVPASLCYQEDIRKFCCETCKKHETSIPDCQYGDKAAGCDGTATKQNCAANQNNFGDDCCGTCNKLTQTATTEEPQTTENATQPAPTQSQPTNPPNTGTQPTNPPNTGTQPTNPPDKGAQPTNPPDKGVQPTNPPDKGAQPTNPPDKGAQPTNPPDKGTQPTNPPDKGTQLTNPPDNGTQPTNPPDKGTQLTNPPDNGTQPTNPPDKGAQPTNPPDKGAQPTAAKPQTTETAATASPTQGNIYGWKPEGYVGCYYPPCSAFRHFQPASVAVLLCACICLVRLLSNRGV